MSMSKKELSKDEAGFLPPKIEEVRFENLRDFYESIPLEGSLGILALGAAGLIAWRKKRKEAGFWPPKIEEEKKKDG
jgi:LPXTG-motif cell wall-anchored protein